MSTEIYGLTPAQVAQFAQQGYLGPFTAFPVAAMVQLLQIIYQRVLPPFVYEAPQQSAKFRHLDSQTVFKLCSAPAIIGRIASLLGLDLLLWHSTLFEKPPTRPDEMVELLEDLQVRPVGDMAAVECDTLIAALIEGLQRRANWLNHLARQRQHLAARAARNSHFIRPLLA